MRGLALLMLVVGALAGCTEVKEVCRLDLVQADAAEADAVDPGGFDSADEADPGSRDPGQPPADVVQDAARDEAPEAAPEVVQEIPQEIAVDLAQEVAQDVSQEAAPDVDPEVVEGGLEEVAADVTESALDLPGPDDARGDSPGDPGGDPEPSDEVATGEDVSVEASPDIPGDPGVADVPIDVTCQPQQDRACVGGNLYWFDGCGRLSGLAETCRYGCAAGSCNATDPCPAGYVVVPSGELFEMGSPASEPGRVDNETPRKVLIATPYCLKATEVTQGEWQAAMGNNPSYFSSCGSTCPAEQLSWWDATAYCNTLSAMEGLAPCYALTGCTGTPGAGDYLCTGATFAGLSCTGYRLPTEAEWEHAARAGTTTATYNGTGTQLECETPNPVLDPIAWFCGSAGSSTMSVAGRQANAWGLYDMLGNVWEWCWDLYGAYPAATETDPTGPATGTVRVARGGAWGVMAASVRSAYRSSASPGSRNYALGLRPARSIPPPVVP